MKKFAVLFASLILVVGMASSGMAAPINFLGINPGVQPGGAGTAVTSGSWFGMDAYGTGSYIPTALNPGVDGGMYVGAAQFEPANPPGGPTVPSGITAVWNFFGNTGVNVAHVPNGNSFDTNGSATMTQWDVLWNGNDIPMGNGTFITFTTTGGATGQYTLDYRATVPPTVPGWGNVPYSLYLEGNYTTVPEPASLLLIGSGLLGLIGIARKRG